MLAGRGLLGRIPGGAIRRLSQATDCKIEAKVHALGLFIPDLSLLGGKFQPDRMVGGSTGRFVVYCAGSIPVDRANNPTYIGRVGADFDIAEGQAASQLAACGLLAQLKSACPNLEAVTACLKIGVYVNSTCYCNPGWSGTGCEARTCLCQNGLCQDGICLCAPGYGGVDCATPTGAKPVHVGRVVPCGRPGASC